MVAVCCQVLLNPQGMTQMTVKSTGGRTNEFADHVQRNVLASIS